jgi:cbb3-type cytochrome oxidase subunit 3
MSLTDIMSNMELSIYPQVGLVIFFGVFVAVAARALRTPAKAAKARASIPLDDTDFSEEEASS